MSAFDQAFHVLEDSAWKRLVRDLRLALWLGMFLLFYLLKGRRVRRLYAEKKAAGEPLWID